MLLTGQGVTAARSCFCCAVLALLHEKREGEERERATDRERQRQEEWRKNKTQDVSTAFQDNHNLDHHCSRYMSHRTTPTCGFCALQMMHPSAAGEERPVGQASVAPAAPARAEALLTEFFRQVLTPDEVMPSNSLLPSLQASN